MKKTFYLIRYAYRGYPIHQAQAEVIEDELGGEKGYYIMVDNDGAYWNDEFHETLEAAQEYTKKVRGVEIARLQSEIDKLQNASLEPVPYNP
jgi:hypothetical protein